VEERQRELVTAGLRAFRPAAQAVADLLQVSPDEGNRRWALPAGPGGVALDPA